MSCNFLIFMTLHLSVINFMMLNELQGDSGGPLTVEDATTKQHSLVGVVSYGDKCATVSIFFIRLMELDPQQPGVSAVQWLQYSNPLNKSADKQKKDFAFVLLLDLNRTGFSSLICSN